MEQLDIAIIGCGPAGLSAAVNAKIRNKSIKVFGAEVCSPKLASAPWIDNYLGFHQITGTELRDRYLAHIKEMGIEIYRTRVDNIVPMDGSFMLAAKTEIYQAKSIIMATGVSQASYLPGERDFVGKGVSYCGTCDGPLYRGKTVAVVAYTHEGVEEANYLASVAQRVIFIPQINDYDGLSSRVEVVSGKPLGVLGESHVTHLALKDQQLEVAGVFIFRDVTPAEQLLSGLNQFNGAIVVDRTMATNIPGVFAAGDCTGRPFQLAKAVGEGLVAGLSAASYVDKSYPSK
ncbi:MAG: NAD(P)/FAD-dependent oxidoreductase [Bacillota bacterium]|nr:NAD(P)/FAD-dependent oxidoreductase [Bacillota bacterium]